MMTPRSWAIALAETIMKRNPGTPGDPRNTDGGFWHSKNRPGEMWIDGVFMGLMFLTRYGTAIGDRDYCFNESAMFTYALQRGIELGLLDAADYASAVSRGYQGIVGYATINDEGLVDISSACDRVCVQESYDVYINYKQTINAKEAVAGFLWATAIVEKPALERVGSRWPPGESFGRRPAPPHHDILGVRGDNIGREAAGGLHRIFIEPQGVAGVENDLQVVGIDAVDDPRDLLRGEVDMLLQGQHHIAVPGDHRRFLEHTDAVVYPRLDGVVHVRPARRHDAHDRRANQGGARDMSLE
ncbi:MAG TPA: glycoside hydrolase family 88 protein [Chloroflexota bacterium]